MATSDADIRPTYAFHLEDGDWLAHLQNQGFVVLKAVGDTTQVSEAKNLMWDAICERHGHVQREDPATWRFPLNPAGIVPWLAQSAGAWAVRGWPGVKRAFSQIWQDDDLIVSMDCALVWRPWWVADAERFWKPDTEGLHLDQNPFSKPYLDCYQGMVPLLPVDAISGGLQVVPGSHLDEPKEAFRKTHQHLKGKGDWCPCDDDDLRAQAILLHAEPGDLIIWDSRLVHGGLVGNGKGVSNETELARLAQTVAMVPRGRASSLVLARRQDGFAKGETFNHCPHEAGTSSGTVRAPIRRDYRPVELSDAQRQLI